MQLTTLTLCLFALVILHVIREVRRGRKRGLTYALLSLATIVLSCFSPSVSVGMISRSSIR